MMSNMSVPLCLSHISGRLVEPCLRTWQSAASHISLLMLTLQIALHASALCTGMVSMLGTETTLAHLWHEHPSLQYKAAACCTAQQNVNSSLGSVALHRSEGDS